MLAFCECGFMQCADHQMLSRDLIKLRPQNGCANQFNQLTKLNGLNGVAKAGFDHVI